MALTIMPKDAAKRIKVIAKCVIWRKLCMNCGTIPSHWHYRETLIFHSYCAKLCRDLRRLAAFPRCADFLTPRAAAG
jgi:hypothetical protein